MLFDSDFSVSCVNEVFASSRHISYLQNNCVDLWEGTVFEGYSLLNNKHKGKYGESITADIMRALGYDVQQPLSSDHDWIINDIKTEVKFSLAQSDQTTRRIKTDVFTLNHAASHKDWNRLIFIGINPNGNHRMFWFAKDVFKSTLIKAFFSRQQGGKTGKNDDYICSGAKLIDLSNSSYVRKLTEW